MAHSKFLSGHDYKLNGDITSTGCSTAHFEREQEHEQKQQDLKQKQQEQHHHYHQQLHPRLQHLSHQPINSPSVFSASASASASVMTSRTVSSPPSSSSPSTPYSLSSPRQSYPQGHAAMAHSNVSGSGAVRISRAPRRESSLSQPLPSVLPCLPPLIPVPTGAAISGPPSGAKPPVDSSTTNHTQGQNQARLSLTISTQTAATQVAVLVAPSDKSPSVPQFDSEFPSPSGTGSGTGPGPGPGPGSSRSRSRSRSRSTPSSPSSIAHENSQLLFNQVVASPTSTVKKCTSFNEKMAPPPSSTSAGPLSLPTQSDTQEKPLSAWPETPRQFLERLKETVSKAELGNVLSKGSDSFHQAVLRTHMESFDFRRDPIDLALRKFLLDFHFPKEAQQIDRVLEAFAFRYHVCNRHLFRSAEIVYTIAFSLMLLHTDAHNKNVRYKMTKEQYVKQAKSIEGVNTVPTDILEILYDNITFLKFVYAEDELDVDGQRIADVHQSSGWFPRRRTTSNQRSDSYTMIRHGSIAHLAPDISDLIPFRWPYYWKGTIEMVDNVQINNQFTKAPVANIPGLRSRRNSQHCSQIMGQWQGEKSSEAQDNGHKLTRGQDQPMDGTAELKIAKFGILTRKIDIENGKKSSVRGWRDLGVILSGSQLLFFTELGWFQQQLASQRGFNPDAPPEVDGYFATPLGGSTPPMPQALISTLDSIAVVDSSYQKYPHVFRLVCPNGKQYLFRAHSEFDMNDWMAKINYASAFKTAGVRLRNYRVAWASDVYWIKDDQGRHQLRRRHPKDQTSDSGQVNGRADLIMAKMKDIDRLINTCSASLAAELRLARGLEVMVPLQNVTRQKIIQSATMVGKRLRHLMLERTKLDCFRTILERDLAVVMASCDSTLEGQGHHAQWAFNNCTRDDSIDGNHQSISDRSSTLRSHTGTDLPMNGDYVRTYGYQVQPHDSRRMTFGMDDRIDPSREDYVLDSSRTSQSSNRSFRGSGKQRLNIPEFSRAVSETTLHEQHKLRLSKGMDIPQGPMAVQAAIIGAARGTLGMVSSTLSSPDPNHFQEERPTRQTPVSSLHGAGPAPIPTAVSLSATASDSEPASASASASGVAVAPVLPLTTSTSSNTLLSPDSQSSPTVGAASAATRARALSMPGQRPPTMPRTVSIYSSSSQTASRLKRILEQGLGHLKWKSSIFSPAPATPPIPSTLGSTVSSNYEGSSSSPEIPEMKHTTVMPESHASKESLQAIPTVSVEDAPMAPAPSVGGLVAELGFSTPAPPVPEPDVTGRGVTSEDSLRVGGSRSNSTSSILSMDSNVDNGEDELVMDSELEEGNGMLHKNTKPDSPRDLSP
ncbi:hypothetical protein BGZ94_010146 [Podila epigama]|nr:hypothetical protein BGZ94_010146 [Podila epigama]